MKSPGRYLGIPVYLLGEKRFNSSKAGASTAPLVSRLDIDDVFGGKSLCVIDYIMGAHEGFLDEPLHIMFVVKKGAKSTVDGWVCEYEKKMKLVMLDDKGCAKAKYRPPSKDMPGSPKDLPREDDMLTDLDEDEFSDAPSSRWGESQKEDSDSDGGGAPDAKTLRNTCMMTEDDRKDRTQEMRGFIDETRYVVYTSRKLN